MKIWMNCFIALAFLSCKNDTTAHEVTSTNELDKNFIFPDDYLGKYKGMLEITSSNGVNEIPMEFHLLATQDSLRYDYKIYYGEERSERSYTLVQTSNPNLFELDENNGIILPVAFSQNTLFSTYEVAGNLLSSTEIFYQDRMDFMITMSSLQDTIKAGQAAGYNVKSYPMNVIQQADLQKFTDSL